MVTPTARRRVVGYLQQAFGMSERRACRAKGQCRAAQRYEAKREEPARLRSVLLQLAKEKPRYGYRFLHRMRRRKGFRVNHKRVYRLYRQEGLSLRRRKRRRRPPPHRARQRSDRGGPASAGRWTSCMITSRTGDGPASCRSSTTSAVARPDPRRLVHQRRAGDSLPRRARRDDRIAGGHRRQRSRIHLQCPRQWAFEKGVKLHFIGPGKPTDNAFIGRFNSRLRDECLNANWFDSIDHARELLAAWWHDYNHERPHSALGGLSPIEYERTNLRTQTLA
jgi:putative transposase